MIEGISIITKDLLYILIADLMLASLNGVCRYRLDDEVKVLLL
jgi:hypothetical protein